MIISYKDRRTVLMALSALKRGKIIAFPTDTVYGMGCSATSENAIKRIYKIKKRDIKKPLVLFIKNKNTLSEYTEKIPGAAEELISKFWPGGLTIVFKAKESTPLITEYGTVGIRIPKDEKLIEILNKFPHPLATTSCNLEGRPTLEEPKKIEDIFGNDIELIIGKARRDGMQSTVIDVSTSPPTILRKGKIGVYEIGEMTPIKLGEGIRFRVTFVCEANLCRSPMAEGIMRNMCKSVEVTSCGMVASCGSSPNKLACEVMKEIGIDIKDIKTQTVSQRLIEESDLILCMENYQKRTIIEMVPSSQEKVFLLKGFKSENEDEVPDPVGMGIATYRRCRDEIRQEVERIIGIIDLDNRPETTDQNGKLHSTQ
jgi:tRNA threonylcarbamoyl adenosine modification protein (Sua5/YciO/YrdC/YwlC family)